MIDINLCFVGYHNKYSLFIVREDIAWYTLDFFEGCAALYAPFFVWINRNICTVPDEQVNFIVFDSRSNV